MNQDLYRKDLDGDYKTLLACRGDGVMLFSSMSIDDSSWSVRFIVEIGDESRWFDSLSSAWRLYATCVGEAPR